MAQFSLQREMTYPLVHFNDISEVLKTSLRIYMAWLFYFPENAYLQIQYTAEIRNNFLQLLYPFLK